MKILHDAIDLLLMRFQPLPAYHYPQWQIVAVLLLVALAAAPVAGLHAALPAVVALLFCQALVQSLILSRFFQSWLRLSFSDNKKMMSPWDGQGSLFTLFVLLQASDLVLPLLLWVDGPTRAMVYVGLQVYVLVVTVRALMASTGASLPVAVGGMLLVVPMLVLAGLLFNLLAQGWGWTEAATVGASIAAP